MGRMEGGGAEEARTSAMRRREEGVQEQGRAAGALARQLEGVGTAAIVSRCCFSRDTTRVSTHKDVRGDLNQGALGFHVL